MNTAGCYGLLAAIELLLEVGIERIGERVAEMGRRIACGVAERGYELLAGLDGNSTSGIVAFRKEGVDAASAVRRLAAMGFILAPRSGWIRASPHFYVSDEEVGRLLDSL